VTFQTELEGHRQASASVRSVTLPPFKSEKEFLAHATREAKGSVPPQWKIRRFDVSNVIGTAAPRVDILGVYEQTNTPIELHGRFCYVDTKFKDGYGCLHYLAGTPYPQQMRESALSFVQRASIR
jgi:hypothetical protein